MNAPPTDHDIIKDYLLGLMPGDDQSEVEVRLLTDRDFYEELSIVEDELIDQYLGGTLSVSDRQSFESHFVSSSERQQKIRFAKALRKYVSVTADESQPDRAEDEILLEPAETATPLPLPRPFVVPSSRSWMSYAVAAAILVAVAGGALLLLRYRQGPVSNGRVLAIELTPAPATRDGSEVKQFSLAPDVGSVRLQLDLPKNEFQSYEAALRDSSSRTVLTAKNLKPQTINSFAAVMWDVNAELLSPGDYRIQLSGTTPDGRPESVATFSFTIR